MLLPAFGDTIFCFSHIRCGFKLKLLLQFACFMVNNFLYLNIQLFTLICMGTVLMLLELSIFQAVFISLYILLELCIPTNFIWTKKSIKTTIKITNTIYIKCIQLFIIVCMYICIYCWFPVPILHPSEPAFEELNLGTLDVSRNLSERRMINEVLSADFFLKHIFILSSIC